MMNDKLRVDGETIDPGKIYSGSRVLRLVEASFNNGIRHASRTLERDKQAAYDRGYQAGYCEASTDLDALRSLLRKILMEEAK